MLLALCLCFCALFVFMRVLKGANKSSTCLVGKTALVTGANSGIGYHAVLSLASRGCRVIMADVEDLQESKRNVIKYTNNTNITIKQLDLASLKSVRDFANDIIKTESKLDILINNAGISASTVNRSKDGLHPVMQVNYFGHFLLTHLLIDGAELTVHPYVIILVSVSLTAFIKKSKIITSGWTVGLPPSNKLLKETELDDSIILLFYCQMNLSHLLKKSAPSRIVFTSSFMSLFNNLSLDNLNYDDSRGDIFSKVCIYNNSKYALLIASDIFAKKLRGTGVTSNSVNPGMCATPMVSKFFHQIRYTTLLNLVVYLYMWIFSKSAHEGAEVLVYVAVSKKLENTTGKHFWDCKPFIKPLGAYNDEFCQKIWKASEKYVHLTPSERLIE